jgi:hypothetical protein
VGRGRRTWALVVVREDRVVCFLDKVVILENRVIVGR